MDYTGSIEDDYSERESPVVTIQTLPMSKNTTMKEVDTIKKDQINIVSKKKKKDSYAEILEKNQNFMLCEQYEKEKSDRPWWEKSQIKTFKDNWNR